MLLYSGGRHVMPPEAYFLGISTKVGVAGLIGSAVGMVLGTGKWWERGLRGIVGACVAYVAHVPTSKIMVGLVAWAIDKEHLPSPIEMEPVAAFFAGVVGMVLCQAVINAITAVRDKADDYVEHNMRGDE